MNGRRPATRIRDALRSVLPRGLRVEVEPRDESVPTFTVIVRAGKVEHRFVVGWALEGWPADVERLLRLAPTVDVVSARAVSIGARESLARAGSGGSTRPAARISHSLAAWWWYETRSVSLSDQRRTRVGLVRQLRWQRRSCPGPTHGSTACSTPPACPAVPLRRRSRRSNTAGSSIGRPNAVRAQPGTSPTSPGCSTATRPR